MINTSAARVYRGDNLFHHSAPSMIALALLLAVSAHGSAQSAPPAKESSARTVAPTLKVYSRETLVDVTVTDSKGNPVHNLTRDDFTISEDGHPQPIRAFSETSPERAIPVPPLPKLPPGVYTNRQPPPSTGAANIILLDDLNVSDYYDQVRERQHAVDYIKSMPGGTQIALMELWSGLRIVQGFTTDPAALIAALNDKQSISFFPPPGRTTSDCPPEYLDQTTLKALRDIAGVVAGTKGRKNLVWFTVGIKRITDPLFLPACEIDPTPALHQTYALLADAQIAVYSVDARGIANQVNNSAASASPPINTQTGATVAAATGGALVNYAGDHLSMESVAESTGGGAFYNTNDLKAAIGKAIDSGSSFYSISYVPPNAAYDGRHHMINVKVDRPGLHLVYRTSYYAEDPYKVLNGPTPKLATAGPSSAQNTMNASMARFAPPVTQLIFNVQFAPTTTAPRPTDPPVIGFPAPDYKSKPMTRCDLLYSIPPDEITFTTAPDGAHTGSVQFDIVASDVNGKLITSISRTLQLPLSPDEYDQFLLSPFQFLQQIDLPAGQLFVRVGILDEASKKIGTLEIPLTVPKK